MNIREFNDHILHSKKAHFLACVKLAAETINAPIPKVNFEGCTSFDDDLAHIHTDQNKICVLEEYLKRATDEDLHDTATHEVTHLIDETHNISFVKAHSSVKTASWIRKHTSNVINETKMLNSYCVTPAPKVEKIEPLESLKSQYRILISEIDDCIGKGHLIKRKELLEKVSKVAGEIRAIETPISETNVEQQTHNPDWVDIENEKHNLDLSKIPLEEKNTKELTEDIKTQELVSTKKELRVLEPEPENSAIRIESKEKTFQERNPDVKAEYSIKYHPVNYNYETAKILDKKTDIPKLEIRSRYTLFAIIIFIISIISIAIFIGIVISGVKFPTFSGLNFPTAL